MGTAALFAGVAGEFDAVDGKHVPTNEALGITGHQDLGEQGFDLATELGGKLGDVGVAGSAVATDGDELDVAATSLFYPTAGDDALAVGQQDDLEHDARVVGAGAYFVVLELGIQGLEVEFVVDQIVQCEGEAAGEDLLGQHHGQQEAVAVLGFVAGHLVREIIAINCMRFWHHKR